MPKFDQQNINTMPDSKYPKLTTASKKSNGTTSKTTVSKTGGPTPKPKGTSSKKEASNLNLLKISPKDSPEQRAIKERENEKAAVVYNRNRTGSAGIKNHTPYGGVKGQTAGKDISVLTVDPESSRRADSVAVLMQKKYAKKK